MNLILILLPQQKEILGVSVSNILFFLSFKPPGVANFGAETVLGPVYSKPRKMIVLSVFDDHCLVLPIFSFNNNSLKYKKNKDDFVGIDDRISKSPAPQENSHTRLKFTRSEEFKDLTTGFQYVLICSSL